MTKKQFFSYFTCIIDNLASWHRSLKGTHLTSTTHLHEKDNFLYMFVSKQIIMETKILTDKPFFFCLVIVIETLFFLEPSSAEGQ